MPELVQQAALIADAMLTAVLVASGVRRVRPDTDAAASAMERDAGPGLWQRHLRDARGHDHRYSVDMRIAIPVSVVLGLLPPLFGGGGGMPDILDIFEISEISDISKISEISDLQTGQVPAARGRPTGWKWKTRAPVRARARGKWRNPPNSPRSRPKCSRTSLPTAASWEETRPVGFRQANSKLF